MGVQHSYASAAEHREVNIGPAGSRLGIIYWPRLLTPIVGVNNRHKSAIDTDSVSTIATNRLLTPTNDSFHLLSAEMRRRGTHASLDFLCDGSALIRPRSQRLLVSAGTGSVLMRFTMVCRNVRGVYDATVLSLGLAIPTPARNGFRTETTLSHRCLHNMYMRMQVNKNKIVHVPLHVIHLHSSASCSTPTCCCTSGKGEIDVGLMQVQQ